MQLDPNFALAWARLSRADAYTLLGASDTTPALGAMRRNVLWRMRRNWSRTRLKPCLPWVIINTGCCGITGLPKLRSVASAKCYPGSSEVPKALALIARREGHWDQSIAYFEQALTLDPRNVELLIDAAGTYAMLRQFPTALKLYDRVLDITPNDPDTMAAKASIYQAEGNLQEAAKMLPEINSQTLSGIPSSIKINQLRLERNYGEAVRLLQARETQFHFDSRSKGQ